jgi:dihydroflavonol-4-reductase
VVVHTASPVAEDVPDVENDLIRPAVEGVRNVVESCRRGSVPYLVATNSVAAIGAGRRAAGGLFDESDRNERCRPEYGAYAFSKVEAERVMRELCAEYGIRCATLHPALIWGPQLTTEFASSNQMLRMLARREIPFVPPIHSDWVDVRDVAAAHLAVATSSTASGRFIVARGEAMWFAHAARVMSGLFPALRVPTSAMPRWSLRMVSWFDRRVTRYYLDTLVVESSGFDGTRLTRELEFRYTHNLESCIRDSVESMKRLGVVRA